jgi:hypothetical protein
MAINLVSLISQFLTPQLVGSLARAAGINEAVAQRLVAAAIPTILGALGTAAAAPGGAQKVADAVSNSDPDLLGKLASAISGGNVRSVNEGATVISGLIGGSGLSSLVGALSQFSGAPQPAAQSAVGAVTAAVLGTIGQQDPSNWSDASSIASFLGGQKDAIASALPPDIAKALGATGLLAGIGGIGAAAAKTAASAAQTAASAAQTASSTAASAANRAQSAATSAASSAAAAPGRFPMWAIIVLIIVVLIAIWWFMQSRKEAPPAPEPQKQGMLAPAMDYALLRLDVRS